VSFEDDEQHVKMRINIMIIIFIIIIVVVVIKNGGYEQAAVHY